MSERFENNHQVVVRNEDTVHVWEKDSAGCTTKEGHTVYHTESGRTTDHYGNIVR